jgi:hypothetical protein
MADVVGLLNEALEAMKKAKAEALDGWQIQKAVAALQSELKAKWPDMPPPDVRT